MIFYVKHWKKAAPMELRALTFIKPNWLSTSVFLVWVLSFIGFYSLNYGITCTNDGSHFALVKSLYERKSAQLMENIELAQHDSAVYEGRKYSDRNPGLAVMTLVYLRVTDPIRNLFVSIQMDPWSSEFLKNHGVLVARCMVLPALFGSLFFVVLFTLFRLFRLGFLLSLLISFVVLVSTLSIRYGTVFYSHMASTCLVSAFFLFLIVYDRTDITIYYFLAVFSLALANITEHPTLLLWIPTLVYLGYFKGKKLLQIQMLSVFIVGLLIPLIPFFIYNQWNFGSPFSIAHFHHASSTYNHSIQTIFNLSKFPSALYELLFSTGNFISIFGSSPYLYLSLLVVIPVIRRRILWSKEETLFLVMFFVALFPAAVFTGHSGYDRDYRQGLFAIPFIALVFGVSLNGLLQASAEVIGNIHSNRWVYRIRLSAMYLLLSVVVGLFGFSAYRQFSHITHQWQAPRELLFINIRPAVINTLPFILFALLLVGITSWLTRRIKH